MSGLIEWLNKNDDEQHEWAFQYLNEKGLVVYSNPTNRYQYLVDLENTIKTNPHYILAVRSMKAAWRQKKLREKRKGKVEFSLVINKEKKRKLTSLAQQRGKTLGETLEDLINDELTRKEEFKEELKKEKLLFKQKNDIYRNDCEIKKNDIEKTADILLYLLEENLNKMIQYEIDAFKANHSAIHEHVGTKEFKEERFLSESENINNALKKINSWYRKSFPLPIATKFNARQLIYEGNRKK